MEVLMNSKELTQIYTWNNSPSNSFEHARNLGHELGASSVSKDLFNPYLFKLIEEGVLNEIYDFTKDGTREALYEFQDGKQIEFIGKNHMNYKLFYLY